LLSYAKDIVFNVEISMQNATENLAVFTLPRTPYEINVYGSAPDGMPEVQSTFEKGGHPENGPFASSANTYTVRYLNRSDALYGDFVVWHDCNLEYNYVVYAKNNEGEFVAIPQDCTWLKMLKFKKVVTEVQEDGMEKSKSYPAFRLEMVHNDASAVNTKGVGYEAYVNLEDENGDALVSVYFLYDPSAVAPVKPAIELAYPDDAAAKGVTFEGKNTTYTLTLPTQDLLGENSKAASLKIIGYSGGGYMVENLTLLSSDEANVYYTALAEGATLDGLLRENTLSVSAINAEGAKEYTITVVLQWVPEAEVSPDEIPEE